MGNQLRDALKKVGLRVDSGKRKVELRRGELTPHPAEENFGSGAPKPAVHVDASVPSADAANWTKGVTPIANTPGEFKTPAEKRIEQVMRNYRQPKVGGDQQKKEAQKLAEEMKRLKRIYGKTKTSPASAHNCVTGTIRAEVTGPLVPNPLLVDAGALDSHPFRPRLSGIDRQLTANPTDETELVLGLDFGTSAVKAVIRDHYGHQAYAVPFVRDAENPYLLPSRVYRTGDQFSLLGGDETLRDLKLRLLNSRLASPVLEFEEAAAFLALVVRHCRGWLLDRYGPRYREHEITWRLNLGLPARSYEDVNKVAIFRRLAWTAANAAASADVNITNNLIERLRLKSFQVIGGDSNVVQTPEAQFTPEYVDVVPEIAAQAFGFVDSSNWDAGRRPMMIMIDVGAGTVDAAFFSVVKQVGKPHRFVFFADEVEPIGVMNLHRGRIKWLRELLKSSAISDAEIFSFLDRAEFPTDRLAPIPESVTEYLGGIRMQMTGPAENFDSRYYRERYAPEIFGCIRRARREKGVPDTQLQGVPCFLCGGGNRMRFYRSLLSAINSAPITVNVVETRIPKPGDLIAEGLREHDYDRLSVAYGLSRQGAGGRPLGEYVRSIDIPSQKTLEAWDYEARYIDKSMT